MLVALHVVIVVAVVPLNFTLPFPCDGPKFDPAITMEDPTAPVLGVSNVMLGAAVTVKLTPLLAVPTVTTTLPVVAPVGTVAVMLDAPQLVVVAVVPLNLTVLVPLVDPKFDPAITMEDPDRPGIGRQRRNARRRRLYAGSEEKHRGQRQRTAQLPVTNSHKPNLPRMNNRSRLIAFGHSGCCE